MRYFNWLWRAALFIALLGFALKNDQSVTLQYFFGHQWESPLVIILLIFFAAGAIVGVVVMLPDVLRQRREISRLKREINLKNKLAGNDETQKMPIQPS